MDDVCDVEYSCIFVFRSVYGMLNIFAAISTIPLTLWLVRDSSIVSLLSLSLSSLMLWFGYCFAPFEAGLHGVGRMLLIRSRMAHSNSMTTDLDMTSSPYVDVLRVVVLVFFEVDFHWSHDVTV